MSETKYTIGKIVSLKSNHLKSNIQYSTVNLAGEPNFITPLMIVSEILIQKPEIVDEETGDVKNSKGSCRYKCIWFSNKSFKIEENWFFEKELLDFDELNVDKEIFKFGETVVLKTNFLELQKKKTNLELATNFRINKISSLLNFCSPIFTFMGYQTVEKKEPEFDSKTLNRKRFYPEKIVKVKTFNSKEDKYSEFLFPIEAILKVNEIETKIIDDLVKTINTNKEGVTKIFFQSTSSEHCHLYDVKSILTLSNQYLFICENIFNQQTSEVFIHEIDLCSKFELPLTSEFYPDIIENDGKFLVQSILEYLQKDELVEVYKTLQDIEIDGGNDIIQKIDENKLFVYKIGYKNKQEKYTSRFIVPQKFFYIEKEVTDENDDTDKKKKKSKKKEYYLKAFCLLRNDYRNFNIERMQTLEIINHAEIIKCALNIFRGLNNETN